MKILVIDDHPLFIDGISQVLGEIADNANLIKATSGEAALQCLSSSIDIDLILLDLNMPKIDGISLLQRLNADEMCIPVIIISSEENAVLIKQAFDLGAMGFIPKSYSSDAIISAVEYVLEGNLYIPETVKILLNRLQKQESNQNIVRQNLGISKKQFEVLRLLAKGYSNEQIASALHRTEHTVKSHIAALFQILEANNRTECVKLAEKKQLLID